MVSSIPNIDIILLNHNHLFAHIYIVSCILNTKNFQKNFTNR